MAAVSNGGQISWCQALSLPTPHRPFTPFPPATAPIRALQNQLVDVQTSRPQIYLYEGPLTQAIAPVTVPIGGRRTHEVHQRHHPSSRRGHVVGLNTTDWRWPAVVCSPSQRPLASGMRVVFASRLILCRQHREHRVLRGGGSERSRTGHRHRECRGPGGSTRAPTATRHARHARSPWVCAQHRSARPRALSPHAPPLLSVWRCAPARHRPGRPGTLVSSTVACPKWTACVG